MFSQVQDRAQFQPHECVSVKARPMASLADRFQVAVTQKKHEEYQGMSYEQLSQMQIAFGEAKVNQTFIHVIKDDPKYVAWFLKKYSDSKKAAHQPFLYFIQLYVERMELLQDRDPEMPVTEAQQIHLEPKSRAMPPRPDDALSQESGSASEHDKPWSLIQEENSVTQGELSAQRERISNMENSLAQITQQLQTLTQLAMQGTAHKNS